MVLRKLQAQYSRLQEAHVSVLAIVRVRRLPLSSQAVTAFFVSRPHFVFAWGENQELPSVAAQWSEDLRLSFPILSDPNLEVSAQYVGTFDIGEYLKRAGVTPHLVGCITCRPAIVLVDKARVVRAIHMATKNDGEVDIGKRWRVAISCVGSSSNLTLAHSSARLAQSRLQQRGCGRDHPVGDFPGRENGVIMRVHDTALKASTKQQTSTRNTTG